MIDANQGWDLSTARPAVEAFSQFPLDWIEELIPADDPTEHWAELAMLSRIPLAGGENLIGFQEFDAAIGAGHLGVIQPDICKWGEISCCVAVARRAIAAGRRYKVSKLKSTTPRGSNFTIKMKEAAVGGLLGKYTARSA
jgi:L-alanine-DL-glutamate epimerase-like enolase superfamily enzyme